MRAVRFLIAFALILGSFAVATPVAAGDPCYHGFDIPERTESTDPQVKLMPCAFAPTVVRVDPGTTVEFFSGPYDVHLITGANQEWGSRDDEIQPDSMVSFRFDRAGTYPYACAIHRGMSGVIVVGDGVAGRGTGPAVVTVVGPKSKASPPPATPSPSPVAAAPVASAPVAAAPVSAPVTSTGSGAGPLLAVGLVVLIVASFGAYRRATGRRASRSEPLRG